MSQFELRPLRIAQITDLHIGDSAQGIYVPPVDTSLSLRRVLAQVDRDLPDADLMLVTGDLAQEPSEFAYRRARDMLSGRSAPVHCLPGNHDDPDMMEEILRGPGLDCARVVYRNNWALVMLDSTSPGEDHGVLGAPELELLEETLDRHPAAHVLICLHHHVMPVGSPWLDRLVLADAKCLFRAIERHARVRGVLFGHIHQAFEAEYRGVRIMGTPSTCLQFRQQSKSFGLDSLPPAWRRLTLHPDGRIETSVEFVEDETLALRLA